METLSPPPYSAVMEHTQTTAAPATITPKIVEPSAIRQAIRKQSFATIATSSAEGRPHAAGVLYAMSADRLYVSTMRSSRKARNVLANPDVALTIPVRRAPIGPPSSVIFQATAKVIELDDPKLRAAAATGDLKAVTGHGELVLPGGVFIAIDLPPKVVTYGLGMSLLDLIRNPMSAAGVAYLA